MIQVYPCGCQITRGFLWVRCCWRHKTMQQSGDYSPAAIMASIILQKHPNKLDPYEDQLIITQAYARLKDGEASPPSGTEER